MKPTFFLVSAIVMLASGYLGSYVTNIDDGFTNVGSGPGDWDVEPKYRSGGTLAKVFYWPVFQVDKRLRPERWSDDQLPQFATGQGFNHYTDRISATCLNPAVPSRP